MSANGIDRQVGKDLFDFFSIDSFITEVQKKRKRQEGSEVIPIDPSRSGHIDFSITCFDREYEFIAYGVETAKLTKHSVKFARIVNDRSKSETLSHHMNNFRQQVVLRFLKVITAAKDDNEVDDIQLDDKVLSLDDCSDLIDMGKEYKTNVVINYGLEQFSQAFYDLASNKDSKPEHTRFGKGALIKFFSLWRKGIEGELFWTNKLTWKFRFSLEDSIENWYKLCGIRGKTAIPSLLIEPNFHTLFDGQDLVTVCLYLTEYPLLSDSIFFDMFFEDYKKKKIL